MMSRRGLFGLALLPLSPKSGTQFVAKAPGDDLYLELVFEMMKAFPNDSATQIIERSNNWWRSTDLHRPWPRGGKIAHA